jgi:ABC-2 type transport system permease protein
MTFVSPLIFVGVILLISWLTSINADETRKIAILDQTEENYAELFENGSRNEYILLDDLITEEQAVTSSEAAQYYGLLVLSNNDGDANRAVFYSDDSPSSGFIADIENKINKKATESNLITQGINLETIRDAKVDNDLILQKFSGEQTSKQAGWIKIATGGAAGYLLMMFIIIYGNMLMRSVIEEKTNRIIEIIVSSVKPIYLMLGKIIGTSLAGITQFLIWLVIGGILITLSSIFLGADALQNPANAGVMETAQDTSQIELIINDIAQLPILKLVVCFFIYFIGGYFLYASIYAAIGAAVDNETDTQQFMLPIILPLMLGIYVGFFSVMENPHGTVPVIFSYIPLTSPIVMLMRIPFGEIALWEIALSVTILYASIFFLVYIAAKIYRIGILMYGKKPSWKQLYKWLRY